MIKFLKNKGFRKLIINLVIFIGVLFTIYLAIKLLLTRITLLNDFTSFPSQISIESAHFQVILADAILFGIVAFIIYSYKKITYIKNFPFKKYQYFFYIMSVILLVAVYIFNYIVNKNISFFLQMPQLWAILKILLIISFAIALGIGIFGLEFLRYFIKDYKKELLEFIGITLAFFFLMLLVQNLWTYFSSIISNILYYVFSIFFHNVSYQPYVTSFTMTEGGGPMLGINGFKAIIGKPCSGIDSFLLFTSLYALIFIMDYKRIKKGLAIALFFIGAVGMFFVNVLRILLLFIVGAYIDAKFAVGMFHTNAGWILFILYFFIFWWIASGHIYKAKSTKK